MPTTPFSQPKTNNIRRIGILFAGGPAPAANAVISTCAASFLKNNVDVSGILFGYSNLVQHSADRPMKEGEDYINIDFKMLKRTRNTQGILIGTSRTNPGKDISAPDHFEDPQRTAPLKRTYDALCSMDVDALVSIGGDDTLKTANKFKLYQDRLPAGSKRIPVVHLPKTIDNDYRGIDFTFGYFTAVEFLASELRNLIYDAEAGRTYFLAETMGRSAGWLAYGAAIAGEASLVLSVEDMVDGFLTEEIAEDGHARKIMNLDEVVKYIVDTMLVRDKQGKQFGVIVLAEGLAELLPSEHLKGVKRDAHGHIAISEVDLGPKFARLVAGEYEKQSGRKRKVTGVQLGYESRCAKPHAFDVMLGSQLGVGAFRALVEEGLDGVMVSVSGQLDLHYVPFEELVNPETLVTVVRHIEFNSDFHKLARFLETNVNK